MGVLITDDEMDDEERCELLQDEDSRCPNRATQSVREPYTPASFEMRVCDECARSQIHFGYIAPMSLRRVAFALKEAYKAARCGSWEELYYFNGLLTTFFVRRDTGEQWDAPMPIAKRESVYDVVGEKAARAF